MRYLLILTLFICSLQTSVARKYSVVFRSGTDGHDTYRIPAIIRLHDGTLLAFAEGRVKSSDDFGNIDIVLKRSKDNGQNLGAPQITVADYGNLQAGNPAPVVDLTDPDFPHGRIFLFYNTGNNHEDEVRKGNGCREVWYKTSTDGGITWTEAVNISSQVHRPYHPEVNKAYSFAEDWRSYANTPGHAMQFESGRLRGRIVVARKPFTGRTTKGLGRLYFSCIFSQTTHGKSFSLSQVIPVPGSNEATAAEIFRQQADS